VLEQYNQRPSIYFDSQQMKKPDKSRSETK
jgi:hypothetical protein